MLTGELRNKIDNIWTTCWTEGLTNPLSIIEQLTYLIFMRRLDMEQSASEKSLKLSLIKESDVKRFFPQDKDELRWSKFKNKPSKDIYAAVTAAFKHIKENGGTSYVKYMSTAQFLIPTEALLDKLVNAIDELPMADKDTMGDMYEYLLSKLSTSGTNGQFRTPRHIIKLMVDIMAPTPTDLICDPAMGSGGFLMIAEEYLRHHHGKMFSDKKFVEHYNKAMFTGYDMDDTMLRIGAMNMLLHGVQEPNISYANSLSDQNTDTDKYTLILANPPFKGSLDAEQISKTITDVVKTKKTELLFIAQFLRSLSIGGRCACIVPDGVLFGSSTAHVAVRKELVERQQLQAVISMPSGVFKPYAGVSTAILIFYKTDSASTDNVWFYDMQADGYSLDDKRAVVESNDIPDIIARYKNMTNEQTRKRTEKSFIVPKAEIVGNNYDLSINKYKEVEHTKVEYDHPNVITDKLIRLEQEILSGLAELKGIMK